MTERDLERVLIQSVQDVHLSDAARRAIRLSAKEERPVTSKKFVAIVLAVVLALILKRAKEPKTNPYKNEIFSDTKDFQLALARAEEK